MQSFKEISDDEEGTGNVVATTNGAPPAKKKKLGRKEVEDDDDRDCDFRIAKEDIEEAEAEEAEASDNEIEVESVDENGEQPDSGEDTEIENDNDNPMVAISLRDIDDLLLELMPLIKRHLIRPVPNRTLPIELVKLEEDKKDVEAGDQLLKYKCYNEVNI